MSNTCTKPMYIEQPLTQIMQKVPCGQCIGCRLEKAGQWATRCYHEAQLYDQNSFITLTYAPKYLPDDLSVNKGAITRFIRRLRRKNPEKEIRFYGCGEYGENFGRPHYHLVLFNHDFEDKVLLRGAQFKTLKNHFKKGPICDLYRSPTLEKLWPYGFSTIGEVTFDSTGS